MAIKLEKVYANYGDKQVLENITIEFSSAMITGIIGPSGSGKTTLIEIMALFQNPTKGLVSIKSNMKIGFVFEFPEKQFFCNTVYDELRYGLKDKKNEKRISDVMKIVDLGENYLGRNPINLSNGEKRRVAIAAILISNPNIIILDEPTIGLDKNGKDNLIRLIKLLKEKFKKTIIIVSQDIDFVYDLVDDVCIINGGQLRASGEKKAILTQIDLLEKNSIKAPKIIELTDKIRKKTKQNFAFHQDINDLLKDIYRYVK